MNLEFLGQAASLLIPLVFSGLVLILCIKKRWLVGLDTPIDRGVVWRGAPLFGRNKTYRGVLVHFVFAIGATYALAALYPTAGWVSPVYATNPLVLGALFAAAYVIGELINSFIKRRLAITPGKTTSSTGWAVYVQHFFDTADGILLVGLVLGVFYGVAWLQVIIALVMAYAVHLLIDSFMRALGLKKRQK